MNYLKHKLMMIHTSKDLKMGDEHPKINTIWCQSCGNEVPESKAKKVENSPYSVYYICHQCAEKNKQSFQEASGDN
jgi:hypothetical protein